MCLQGFLLNKGAGFLLQLQARQEYGTLVRKLRTKDDLQIPEMLTKYLCNS